MESETMAPPRAPEQGFSILELVIAMAIAVEVLLAAGVIFDVHNRMAVVQTQITDMQQSLRISQYDMVRLLRMTGRGGLPTNFTVNPGPPARLLGAAIEVRNAVSASDDSNQLAVGRDEPRAVEGTDILTLRGCISTPLYQVAGSGVDFQMVTPTTATITLSNPSPVGIPQCLRPMAEQLPANGGPGLTGPMILGSPRDRSLVYVGQITGVGGSSGDPMDCAADADPSSLTINLDLQPNVFSAGAFDPAMGVALVCQLEEYRYYVREGEANVGPDSVEIAQPRLSRARMVPGTELPWANDAANLQLDIADGIFDLQVAMGFDSDYPATDNSTRGAFGDDTDNLGTDDTVFEGEAGNDAARQADDWLYNTPGDRADDIQWRAHQFPGNTVNPVDLLYVRMTLAARTARPDPRFEAEDVDGNPNDGRDFLEDNDYENPPASAFREGVNRNFRHRVLQTLVDLRNLG